jgi:ribosomal protein S18 acetylase RimI-like enzyme
MVHPIKGHSKYSVLLLGRPSGTSKMNMPTTANETVIRFANEKDVGEVAELFDLYRQFYQQPSDIHLAQTYIQARIDQYESIILVAENDNQLIGFCQLYPTFCSIEAARIYTLYDLFVHPDFRRSGAGRLLLLAAEQHALKEGFVRLDLTTARTNIQAQQLYESLDWVRDEVYIAYSKSI